MKLRSVFFRSFEIQLKGGISTMLPPFGEADIPDDAAGSEHFNSLLAQGRFIIQTKELPAPGSAEDVSALKKKAKTIGGDA